MRKTRKLLWQCCGGVCAAIGIADLTPASATTINGYLVGNSLTYHAIAADRLKNDATTAGISFNYGMHILCGSSLEAIWNNPTQTCVDPPYGYGTFDQALPNNTWDFVTLETYGDTLPVAQTMVGNMIGLTRNNPANASTKFYIYEGWPQELNGQDYTDRWLAAYDGSRPSTWSRDMYGQLETNVIAAHPELPSAPRLVQTSEVLYHLDQLAETGQLPGTNGIEEWYGDIYHLNAFGAWSAQETIFATVFGQSPVGLPPIDGMSEEVAAIVQQTVWATVTEKSFGQWKVDQDSTWSDGSAWSGVSPNSFGATAIFAGGTTGPHTITLDAPKTVGEVDFLSATKFTIAGTSTLTLNTTQLDAQVTVTAGSHDITAPLQLAKSTIFRIGSGSTLNVTNLQPTSATIYKSGDGILAVNQLRAGSLNVVGGTLRLSATVGGSVNKASSLTVASSARLDLMNNNLITSRSVGSWNGTAYTSTSGLLASGRNGDFWNGYGIVTSMSDATVNGLTALGIASVSQVAGVAATDTTVWQGQTVTGSNTLVMYTYAGDATLDGKINVDDYTRIDFNVALGVSGWYNGDFNYDGKINVDDYTIIDFNVGIQGAPLLSADGSGGLSAVPEPATLGALSAAAIAMPLRRRRRARAR